MGNEFDFSELSENLNKEIEDVIDKEASKAMDDAVDAVIKASENADDAISDAAEETANSIEEIEDIIEGRETENSEATDVTEVYEEEKASDEVTEAEANAANDEEVPEIDLSAVNFDDALVDDVDDIDDRGTSPDDILFEDINLALAEQVEKNLGPSFAELLDEEEGKDDDDDSDNDNDDSEGKGFLDVVPKWLKIVILILLILVLLGLFLLFTRPGHDILTTVAAKYIIGKTNVIDPNEVRVSPDALPTDIIIRHDDLTPTVTGEGLNPATTDEPSIPQSPDDKKAEERVINILLIGEENYYKQVRGRSDSMILASMDKNGGPLKIVSFMRDLYVNIPGYGDQKLNAAYSLGGTSLLIQTIEENFRIKIDGCVLIEYEDFEAIIDKLGGLEISLTQEEAEYLQTTDYISIPEQRNVKAGNQLMTGSQVLGYCRVRKVKTAEGYYADYGRTYRQRLVIKKLFDKYKSKSITELFSLMNECLQMVDTSEGLDVICKECLDVVFENGMFDLESYRVPFEDDSGRHFESLKVNGQDVLSFYPDNITLLHNILYGEE